MALEGTGRLGQPTSNRTLIYISTEVARDSAFPFKKGDSLTVRIEGPRIVVEKATE